MEDPATGKLMIVPFMEENKPLGYITVEGGNSKLTNVHSTANFAGYYYEVIEYAGVNGFPYAFKPYKATTNVSNHGGTSNFMGFHDGAADAGTAVKFEAKDRPSLLYRQLPAAIASANAGCPGSDRTGDMLNGYTAASVDAYKAKVVEAEGLYGKVSETTDEVITAQKNTLANLYHDVLVINLPQDGKFYRIRCTDGNRRLLSTEANKNAEGQAVDMRLTLANTVTDESIYCYSGGQLISYTKGLTINDRRFNEVGVNSVVTFSKASEKVLGTYNIKVGNNNHIFGAGDKLDSGSGTPDARAGYRWWVEEVTTIPVTVSSVGVATLYTPVALEIPADVNVYTAGQDNDVNVAYLKLQLVKNYIPANTGVILEANAGTYDFNVTDEGVDRFSPEENVLTGKCETSNMRTDVKVYTLQKPKDKDLGFYLFMGTKPITGFRSWLELPKDSQVQSFRFKFGTTTDIESLVTLQNAKAIYDLSGRRVENMDKGIYIVNGKKIVVK
jgi:hypothetical protein